MHKDEDKKIQLELQKLYVHNSVHGKLLRNPLESPLKPKSSAEHGLAAPDKTFHLVGSWNN